MVEVSSRAEAGEVVVVAEVTVDPLTEEEGRPVLVVKAVHHHMRRL